MCNDNEVDRNFTNFCTLEDKVSWDTAWAGYQSVVEYVDHFAPVRTRGDKSRAHVLRLLTSEEPAKTKRAAWSALANA